MIQHLFHRPYALFKKQGKDLIPFFFLGLIITNIEAMALLIGVVENSFQHYLYIFLEGLLSFWVYTSLILKSFYSSQNKEWSFSFAIKEGLYSTPTNVLYTLLFTFFFLLGGVFLLLPGVYVFIIFFLAPIVAVLDPDCKESYFTQSKLLVKQSYGLMIVFSLTTLFLSIGLDILPNSFPALFKESTEGFFRRFFFVGSLENLWGLFYACQIVHIYNHLKNNLYYGENPPS